jgi:hypothetical protein
MRKHLVLAIGAALLVGCAPTPEPDDSPPAAEGSSSTPTPTPTPTPTRDSVVRPELSELIISPDGLGPILIGRAYSASDPATDLLVWDDTFCGFAETDPSYAAYDYGNWVNTYGGDGHMQFLAEVTYFDGTPESPIIRITTFNPLIRTEDGLGIGSTRAELIEAYGDELVQSPDDAYFPYVVHGRSGQLVFWFSYETPGVVYMLQVLAATEVPSWSFHSTACA